jgi:hypothetical protein
MDRGIPICHGAGCSLNNIIPEFNEYMRKTQWRKASEILYTTNNFPEITGRVCSAPCEAACTLSLKRSLNNFSCSALSPKIYFLSSAMIRTLTVRIGNGRYTSCCFQSPYPSVQKHPVRIL